MAKNDVIYEVRDHVAILTLNKPDSRNAQDRAFLERLDECWTNAADDEDVRVILLKAEGPHFSAGHDMSQAAFDQTNVDYERGGIATQYQYEQVHFFGFTRKWRENPKPSIAAVQGACIAAGLMLCWPCDLIVASDNAWFSDPTILMGVGGVEYHGHTWELGARKAKELLLTADRITAKEAQELGMVNRVVPVEKLEEASMSLAFQIAEKNPFAASMAKRVVNLAVDAMGQPAALQSGFDIHQLQHANALAVSGNKVSVLTDLQGMKEGQKK